MPEQDSGLIDRWSTATTEKEKARLEEEIWAQMRKPEAIRRDELAKLLNNSTRDVDQRYLLFNAGGDADVLWNRVDARQLLLTTAAKLMSDARKMSRATKKTRAECVAKVLAEYDARPYVSYLDGIPFRRGTPPVAPPEPVKTPKGWDSMRAELEKILRAELDPSDPPTFEATRIAAFVELDGLISSLQRKFSQARLKSRRRSETTAFLLHNTGREERIQKACEALMLECPKGMKITTEFLEQASKAKKKLARVYHPDTQANPTEESREKYQALFESYDILEDLKENGTEP